MGTESKCHLPFLDLDIYRRLDGSLGHKVYCKHTHTDLYLNTKSHHHPTNKQVVLSTLIHRARALCDANSPQAKLVFLRDVFKQNGYNDRHIHRALNRHLHLDQLNSKHKSVTFLPFVRTIFNRISRVLAQHNIKSVGLPHVKLSSLLCPIKDHVGLRTPGIYRIPYKCGRVYIGEKGRSVDIRLKEHQRHIRLEHLDKLAIAKHNIDQGHSIQFHNSSILTTKTKYMDRIVREAIENELCPYNINRVGGFCLSKSWKRLIGSLKLSEHDPSILGDVVPHS
jgi:hypothetical protein